jgi:hypothetical protein
MWISCFDTNCIPNVDFSHSAIHCQVLVAKSLRSDLKQYPDARAVHAFRKIQGLQF